MIVKYSVFLAFLYLIASMPAPTHAQQNNLFNGDEPECWLATFTQVGVPTIRMHAVTVAPDGTIYLGGSIAQGNNVPLNGPAVWMFRDNTWSSLDTGFNGTVYALAYGPDGTLYAGGDFTEIGGVPVNGIAMFSGESWEAMGGGLTISTSQQVSAIVVNEFNMVYAGGRIGTFDSTTGLYENSGISSWNGESWQAPGGGLKLTSPASGSQGLGIVHTLDIDDDGKVWVGGRFFSAGSTYVQNIAAWVPGTGWSRPGLFLPEDSYFESFREVHSITARSGADLIITGIEIPIEPILPGSQTANYLRWNGQAWIVPDDLVIRHSTNGKLARVADGTVYLATTEQKDGYQAYNIHMNRDNVWSTIAVGTGSPTGAKRYIDLWVRALALDQNGHLIATGEFRTVAPTDTDFGRLSVEHVARYDGTGWHTIGNSLGGTLFGIQTLTNSVFVLDMATSPEGFITMGGWIGHANGIPINGAVNFDPDAGAWSYLSEPIDAFKSRLETSAIVYDNEGTLIIGGDFKGRTNNADNEILYGVAWWNGSDWQTLGEGIIDQSSSSSIQLNDLHAAPNGLIYAAGSFRRSGETIVRNVAQWNGTSWLPLNNGLSGTANSITTDANGHIIVGGAFSHADGTTSTGMLVRNIARWDGENWHAMGDGLPATVTSLVTSPDGTVHAGTQGGRIYKWLGNQWLALGGEFSIVDGSSGRALHALVFDASGYLYAGGGFNIYEGQTTRRLARWDGETWTEISPGIENSNGYIQSLIVHNDILYMGGQFRNVGNRYTTALATWYIGPSGSVGITDENHLHASQFLLAENYPNPFNPTTTIRFSIPQASAVTLEVYDLMGRLVSRLINGELPAGTHHAVWEASPYASGIYLYRLTSGGQTITGKMMLMK